MLVEFEIIVTIRMLFTVFISIDTYDFCIMISGIRPSQPGLKFLEI
jgi:hypothetical protein